MKLSQRYLEAKQVENPNFIKVISVENAKIYGQLKALEAKIQIFEANSQFGSAVAHKKQLTKLYNDNTK